MMTFMDDVKMQEITRPGSSERRPGKRPSVLSRKRSYRLAVLR